MSILTNLFKQNIEEIQACVGEIDLIKRDPKYFIYERFSKLKNEVDLRNETTITPESGRRYIEVIEEIESAERKCEDKINDIACISSSQEEDDLKNLNSLIKNFETLELGMYLCIFICCIFIYKNSVILI